MGVFVINIAPPRASENETIILAGLVFLMNAETGECSFFASMRDHSQTRSRNLSYIEDDRSKRFAVLPSNSWSALVISNFAPSYICNYGGGKSLQLYLIWYIDNCGGSV